MHAGESEAVCAAHAEWGRAFEARHDPLPPLGLGDVDTTEGRPLVVRPKRGRNVAGGGRGSSCASSGALLCLALQSCVLPWSPPWPRLALGCTALRLSKACKPPRQQLSSVYSVATFKPPTLPSPCPPAPLPPPGGVP